MIPSSDEMSGAGMQFAPDALLPTIHWLVTGADRIPWAAGERQDTGILSPREWERWQALKTGKRRRDWLAGRWAAKRLLQPLLPAAGVSRPLDTIVIVNNPDGAPRVEGFPGISLSISHAGMLAAAAAVIAPGCAVGIDLEVIAPRTAVFTGDYFTAEERQQVEHAPPIWRTTQVNAIWSAKESALKALGVGLRVDTRAVSCRFEAFSQPPTAWTEFTVRLDAARLGGDLPTLHGWWRVIPGYVLTLILGT